MDEQTELEWLTLSRISGCTPAFRRRLQLAYSNSSPRDLLEAPDAKWRSCGAGRDLLAARRDLLRQGSSHRSWQRARLDQESLRQRGASLMALGSELYPPLLAEIHDPPPLLYLRGLTDTLLMPQLAIVGSRRHGVASARAARQIAGDLTAAGFSICSGMALGIDAVAHEAALEANGRTVAVMGTGIDRCYPGRHAGLAERITSQGLLVTEFPPGYGPRRENFPRRNRLISGLCAGVLVVEAARRSGSLITARLAMEQNREVFALPHSIYDPGGAGCNALIKDGAGLVEHAADIAGELGGLLAAQILAQSGEPAGTQAAQNLSARLAALHAAVGYEAVTVDELVLAGHGLASEVVAGLTELQVRGLVVNRGGLYVRNCG